MISKETFRTPRFEPTTIPCEICGICTYYLGTKRCDSCWNMEQGLRMLADKDKNRAIKWLEDKLKELKGVK